MPMLVLSSYDHSSSKKGLQEMAPYLLSLPSYNSINLDWRLQPNPTWTSITQMLINEEVQLSVQNPSSTTETTTGMNSTAMMGKSKKNKNDHPKHKNNQKKRKSKHTKLSSDSQSDSDDDSHRK